MPVHRSEAVVVCLAESLSVESLFDVLQQRKIEQEGNIAKLLNGKGRKRNSFKRKFKLKLQRNRCM